jgi:hypothetical protein
MQIDLKVFKKPSNVYGCDNISTLAAAFAACVLLAFSTTASAQWSPYAAEADESQAREFRLRVVNEWGWHPDSGIALTTTNYARDYLEERNYDPAGQPRLVEHLNPNKLVLFQSKHLDFVVSHITTEGDILAVVERGSGEYLLHTLNRLVDRTIRARFVDIDQSAPFEFKYYAKKSGGAGKSTYRFRIYDVRKRLEPLLELDGVYDDHSCPDAQMRPLRGTVNTENGAVTVISETSLMMRTGPWRYCTGAGVTTSQKHECLFEKGRRRYECKIQPLTVEVISLQDLKQGPWPENAENIRWVIENASRLEVLGFRFPDEFLERLPRHLPRNRQH